MEPDIKSGQLKKGSIFDCQFSNNQMIVLVCAIILIIAVVMLGAITWSSMSLGSGSHLFELQLYFAIGILTSLALLFAFSIAVYVWGPSETNGDSPGKAVFDACVKVIPPIITLIIGAYFGITSVKNDLTPNSSLTKQNVTVTQPDMTAPVSKPVEAATLGAKTAPQK